MNSEYIFEATLINNDKRTGYSKGHKFDDIVGFYYKNDKEVVIILNEYGITRLKLNKKDVDIKVKITPCLGKELHQTE